MSCAGHWDLERDQEYLAEFSTAAINADRLHSHPTRDRPRKCSVFEPKLLVQGLRSLRRLSELWIQTLLIFLHSFP
jgi:hypothetical protein